MLFLGGVELLARRRTCRTARLLWLAGSPHARVTLLGGWIDLPARRAMRSRSLGPCAGGERDARQRCPEQHGTSRQYRVAVSRGHARKIARLALERIARLREHANAAFEERARASADRGLDDLPVGEDLLHALGADSHDRAEGLPHRAQGVLERNVTARAGGS